MASQLENVCAQAHASTDRQNETTMPPAPSVGQMEDKYLPPLT